MSNPPTDYFVDPSIAANSGTGTIGDPFGDEQYALDQVGTSPGRNATHGDRFNTKSGTNEGLSAPLSLATYGTPSFTAPLIFQGYTSAQGDGGVGVIDCNGNTVITNAGDCIHWIDMELFDGPAAGSLLTLAQYSAALRCYIHDTTGHGINAASAHSKVVGNRLEDIGDATHSMILMAGGYSSVSKNYLLHGGTRNCQHGIVSTGLGLVVTDNIISIDGASNGIAIQNYSNFVEGNGVLSAAGTGTGIVYSGSFNTIGLHLVNNVVEGFSGAGGKGIDCPLDSTGGGIVGQNSLYDNTTDYTQNNEHILDLGDNEILLSSGWDKAGSDTYANRHAYFAPANSGNMRTGGYSEA